MSDQITLTPAAAQRVREFAGEGPFVFRLAVEGGGCGGFQYALGLDSEAAPDDASFASEGVGIVVDPLSLPYVKGCTIDFVNDLTLGTGFKVENPNASGGCGCGQSFRVDDDGCPSAS